MLAAAGAAVGLLLSSFGSTALARLYPSNLPRLQEVGVDYRVTLFAIAVALVSAIVFGLVPALQVARPRLEAALKEGGRSGTSGLHHARLRSTLVIAEIALGVVLLVGAGLLIRSFQRLQHVDPGFNSHGVLALNFDLPSIRYKNAGSERFNREFFERLRTQPGVKDAGGIMTLPLSGHNMTISFDIEGKNIPQRSQPSADFFVATPRYFETMQIPLLRGRSFEERDQRTSTKVMIVNKDFADKYFPGEDPVGKHIKPGANDEPGETPWREIIGVVADIRSRSLDAPTRPAYFLPLSQLVWGEPTVLVRATGDPSGVLPEVRDVLRQMDPEIPLYDVRTVDDYVALSVGRQRFQTMLLGVFAAIALALTAVGIYGVIAYTVMQRTQEIGIRMALGASPKSVLTMLLRYAAILAGGGIGIGLIGSLVLTRFMVSMLFGVPVRDPLTLGLVCLVLGSVALLASYIPARRATRLDPMVALRNE
jgi:putative ABC transport system permease protein